MSEAAVATPAGGRAGRSRSAEWRRRGRRVPVHGLGGTQYDLGSMHKRLKNAGFVTHSLTLPGHGTDPDDLRTSPPKTGSTPSSPSTAKCATCIRGCT